MPGAVIAALRGGSGKTIFSVGIIAALRRQNLTVAPFKKGPDYIDAGWLALAAGRPCYNLDTFLIDSQIIQHSYTEHSQDADIAMIEGNRGLYDCIDTHGETSTAELAKLLDLPLILCIDGTKTTRTMAAVVSGCMQFDPDLKLKGVVLNRVAGPRHERILRDSIEYHCGVPVLGAIPRQRSQQFPERHMGLVPTFEHEWAHEAVAFISDLAERYIDLDAVRQVAAGTYQWEPEDRPPNVCSDIRFKTPPREEQAKRITRVRDHIAESIQSAPPPSRPPTPAGSVRIGVLRDSAFQFYYPENLEALEKAGAELVFTSPLSEADLPEVDALYIGGGFPETHADQLDANRTYASQILTLADQGMPIYAECGGLMYLGEKIVLEGRDYAMTGVLPIVFGLSKRPQGHGYTIVRIDGRNPFYEDGSIIKGHEFHYSTVEQYNGDDVEMVFSMQRGTGFVDRRDGLCRAAWQRPFPHRRRCIAPRWSSEIHAP